MLKQSASGVLASFRPSTYPRGYASALHSLRPCWAACLSILQECSPLVPHAWIIEVLACPNSFPQPTRDSHDTGYCPATSRVRRCFRARFRGQSIGFVRRLLVTLGNRAARQMRVVSVWIGFTSRRPSGSALPCRVSYARRPDYSHRSVPLINRRLRRSLKGPGRRLALRSTGRAPAVQEASEASN